MLCVVPDVCRCRLVTNVHTARLISLLVEVNVQIASARVRRRATTEDPAMIGLVNSDSCPFLLCIGICYSVLQSLLVCFSLFVWKAEKLCSRSGKHYNQISILLGPMI